LINLFAILAQGGATTTRAATPKPIWTGLLENPIWLMVIVMVGLWLFMQKSKKGQDQQRKDMLSQLKRGDRIQTIGGILGTVVEAREDEVIVKVDESSNTKIHFARSAIHKVIEADKPVAK
jgi:preprotein translocase subunit YajC